MAHRSGPSSRDRARRKVLPEQSLAVEGDTVRTNPWDALVTVHVGYHLPVAR